MIEANDSIGSHGLAGKDKYRQDVRISTVNREYTTIIQ